MARVRLTKTLVDDLQPPEKGQAFVWDSEVPGFAVRARPAVPKPGSCRCGFVAARNAA